MATTIARRTNFPSLIVFTALVALTASGGALFEPGIWYEHLVKPAWNPPNWIFAPVWTALYVAIAVAGWLVWRRTGRMVTALQFWFAQLMLNWMWSFLFFGLQRPDLALVNISLLLVTIFAFIFSAWRRSHAASLLFVPYALWVSFATSLNFAIWRLNG